jgi:hypothetical protein
MAKITFLGGEETGNLGTITWGNQTFELNKPVEVTDPHIIAKAVGNKFFKVSGNGSPGKIGGEKPDEDEADDEPTPVKRGPGRPPSKAKDEDD